MSFTGLIGFVGWISCGVNVEGCMAGCGCDSQIGNDRIL
jgi:hypothetical protein